MNNKDDDIDVTTGRNVHHTFERKCKNDKVDEFNGSVAAFNHTETKNDVSPHFDARNCRVNESTGSYNDPPESPLPTPSIRNELCCSVLTTVVDFVMMTPSQIYEPEEFEQNLHFSTVIPDSNRNNTEGQNVPPLLLVPVIRIFGPIIRRQKRNQTDADSVSMENHYLNRRPYQSACLYVHGAYPYMLARPTVAGLDGSRNATNDCPWDSPIKVQQMIETIQDTLEKAVQETNMSFQNTNKSNDSNSNDDSHKNKSTNDDVKRSFPIMGGIHQIIRQITVVMGRGFYGYCSGPTAPFLRIEYYNPQDRWKVKRCLEHGISFEISSSAIHTPDFFFPKPRYRSQHHSADYNDFDETNTLLPFHCFEAHIPYTMQFFKDYNLAGMSHLHVSEPVSYMKSINNDDTEFYRCEPVLFRNPLPTSIRDTKWPQHQSIRNKPGVGTRSSDSFQPWVFVDSNTPKEYVWDDSLQSSHGSVGVMSEMSKKMTSCDVELDIHVSNIANQFDVMTNLPTQYEERQRIHWRAVPSLHEIWKQERRRMSELLPPKEDFLSSDDFNVGSDHLNKNYSGKEEQIACENNTPPFTLNVKVEDVVLPGAKLALEGMERLVQVTDGLADNFRRVMQQIVRRHARSISEADLEILRKQKQSAKPDDDVDLTPSYEETIEALGAFGNFFTETKQLEGHTIGVDDINVKNRRYNNSVNMSQESAASSATLSSPGRDTKTQAQKVLSNLSQACSSSMVQHAYNSSLVDEFVLSQRVERGDGIVGHHFENIDDVINPETLAPYEVFDDEDDEQDNDENYADDCHENDGDGTDEQKMTQLLSELRTQINAPTKGDDDSSVDSLELLKRSNEMLCDDENAHCAKVPAHEEIENNTEERNDELKADSVYLKRLPVSTLPPHDVSVQKESPSCGREASLLSFAALPILPAGNRRTVPAFTSEHFPLRLKAQTSISWSEPTVHKGFDVVPVFCAPTRIDVESWHRKQSKRSNQIDVADDKVYKRQKKSPEVIHPPDNIGELRSLTPPDDCYNVEEIDWEHRQNGATELTQEAETSQLSSCFVHCHSQSSSTTEEKNLKTSDEAMLSDKMFAGIGNQGGRLFVEGGGDLKAKTRQTQRSEENLELSNDILQTPVSIMTIEIFVQCRIGRAGVNDSGTIAMTPDSLRDKISAILYVMSEDPGGGDPLVYHERGCIFVPVTGEMEAVFSQNSATNKLDRLIAGVRRGLPVTTLGISSPMSIECVRDERQMLLRLASIVRRKDPDMLLSWDTQASGLGYIIERGATIDKDSIKKNDAARGIDMARLLGRTPTKINEDVSRLCRTFESEGTGDAGLFETKQTTSADKMAGNRWAGSGLGTDWDERVGAGAAAASISGRLVFSGWKIVADEVKHPNCKYLQAVVSSVLNRRIPFHDNLKLAEWYGHDNGKQRWRVISYVLVQAVACLQLFDALDIIGRSGEAARLSGIEFSQSFPGIRGSQYKVEGVLLRSLQSLNSEERGSRHGRRRASQRLVVRDGLTVDSKSQTQSPWKTHRRQDMKLQKYNSGSVTPKLSDRCYFFFSPSLTDTTRQEALESQALTLEPLSGHHLDPVVVCDFTALYPSLVIAYNLCYSTIAGRLEYHSTRSEMRLEGKTTGKVGPIPYAEESTAGVLNHHVKSLFDESKRDRAYVTPTGAIYVSETVVKGVLPQVLDEILCTRAMLKKAAKQYRKHVPDLSPSILRQLEARQLALKYVANVTYGYTSATFSGRCAMPLLADTIVECGRRTLTNAINLANEWGQKRSSKWSGIRVLYGDTDSVFILVPGRSVKEAFLFGDEFCKAVTDSNPPPVQLKLEKVYLGSMMQTKKKYCGMKFESKDERTPTFEAKGLETVRRDQCSLTKKVLRNSLVTLYRSGIEAVKTYLFRQWYSILAGKLSVSDFILTGRVRSRYRGGKIGPVQAALARRLAEADPAKIVRHKERQAYVIVATPGLAFKLRDCVLTPMELLEQWDSYTIHSAYYITKHVNAAIQRCLGLAPYNIDVATWFEASPKPRQRIHFWPSTTTRQSNVMISTFFGSDKCSICGTKCKVNSRSKASVCQECRNDSMNSIITAMRRLGCTQKSAFALAQKCKECNHCFEDANTFASVRTIRSKAQLGIAKRSTSLSTLVTPLANCSCIDCPVTFERHRLRENELEATAICETLDGLKLST